MNIPLIYNQLFYKYFVCLFDGYAIKDITVFKKLSTTNMVTTFYFLDKHGKQIASCNLGFLVHGDLTKKYIK